MPNQPTALELSPTRDVLLDAAIKALNGRVDEAEVRRFAQEAAAAGAPAPIGAVTTVNIAVWGKLTCAPDGQPWNYNISIWGGPAYFGPPSIGFLYTAYDSWDRFFAEVASAHVQAVGVGGALIQANFLREDALAVGQFNGVSGGAGAVEAGGWGKWQRT